MNLNSRPEDGVSASESRPEVRSVRRAKAAIGCLVAAILLLQLRVGIPRHALGTRLWPFIDYPMYAAAKRPGDRRSERQVRVRRCGEEPRPLTATDLHFEDLNYWPLLEAAEERRPLRLDERAPLPKTEPSDAGELLRAQIEEHIAGPICDIELYRRTFLLGRHGVEDTRPPWLRVRSWSASDLGPR